MRASFFLFFIIFLEGYVVLSTELLALRLLIPFVGTATDTVAVVIAAVLMPLAFGYYVGGRAKPPFRRKLIFNLTVAGVILAVGLSHALLKLFFEAMNFGYSANGRLLGATVYSLIFLATPIFLLGQTVPLVSHFFRDQNLSHMAGKILFFSTLGSFMGAVFCTIVLMPWIGVHHSASITIACIAALVFLLVKKVPDRASITITCALILALMMNSNTMMRSLGIVSNNQYNTIQVFTSADASMRFMRINNTFASAALVNPTPEDPAIFAYIDHVDRTYIKPTLQSPTPPIDILVVGGGGMTVGQVDTKNNYTFLDIDPALEDVAQDHLLGHKLPPNKRFVAQEARAFLAQGGQNYDLIFLDIYQDISGVPTHLITREFFESLKTRLKPGGIVVGNFIAHPNFGDAYSMRLDATIRSVFPLVTRHVATPHNGWDRDPSLMMNIIYTLYDSGRIPDGVYNDNVNRSFIDKGRAP